MKRYLGVELYRTQFAVCMRVENGRPYQRQWPIRELKLFAGHRLRSNSFSAIVVLLIQMVGMPVWVARYGFYCCANVQWLLRFHRDL
jgi:hypothetical protein